MTRIKKLLLAGSMAVVTCCVSLSSSLFNISSLFARVKANAAEADVNKENEYNFNNSDDTIAKTVNGKIITVSNIPSSAVKNSKEPVLIPRAVAVSTVNETSGLVTSTTLEENPTVIIKNPYGISLLDKDGNPIPPKSTIENNGDKDETGSEEGETETTAEGDTSTDPTPEPKTELKFNSSEKAYEFIPAQIGTYTVQYAVKDANGLWTTSSVYKIVVSAEQFSVKFVDNDPIVMPDSIDTNRNVDNKYKTVNIALPLFYDGEGKQIEKFVLERNNNGDAYVAEYKTLENVYLNENNAPVKVNGVNDPNAKGRNIFEKYSTYQIKKIPKDEFETTTVSAEYKYSVAIDTKVSSNTAKSNNKKIESSLYELTLDDYHLEANTFYNYTEFPYHFLAGDGLNFIDYRLFETDETSSSAMMPLSSESKSFTGSITYKKDEINLGVSVSSNIRSSATSLGKKTYLPSVNSVNKNANRNAVPAYFYYKIAFIDEKNGNQPIYDSSKLIMGIDDGGLYFIPKADGRYNIYYNAQDFYYSKSDINDSEAKKGHTDAFAEDYDYDIRVSDRTSPDFYFVDNYDFNVIHKEDKTEEEIKKANELIDLLKNTDISYQMPTKYTIGKDKKIVIPAVFAEDNFVDFNNLSITRTISSNNAFKYEDKVLNNFKINVQNGSSSKQESSFSTSLSGLTIDDIVEFTLPDSVKDKYYYAQGIIYDMTTAKNIEASEISTYQLEIKEIGGKKVVVAHKTVDGNKVEDKINSARYFVDTDGTTIKKADSVSKKIAHQLKSSLVATITLDPALFSEGEYTIEYVVTDGTHPNRTGDKFTFTLVKDEGKEIDTEAPEVKFTTATTIGNVGSSEKISIAKPKVTDNIDNRIYTRYFIEALGEYLEIEIDENNKLSFNTNDLITVKNAISGSGLTVGEEKSIYDLAVLSKEKNFRVIALAYDDFADYNYYPNSEDVTFNLSDLDNKEEGEKGRHIGYAVYPISIKYTEDELVPIISGSANIEGATQGIFKQGEKVLISGIKYYDNTRNAYIRSIKVVDSNGNVCENQSLSFDDFKDYIESAVEKEGENKRSEIEARIRKQLRSYNKLAGADTQLTTSMLPTDILPAGTAIGDYLYEYYFPGISFIATESANYTITYEVCDMGTNNVTVYSVITGVATDTQAPVISGITSASTTLELGQTYHISDIKATDNSNKPVELTWEVKFENGYRDQYFNINEDDGTMIFRPQEVGNYSIKITAIDANGNYSSKIFTVKVQDTNKPVVELEKVFPKTTFGKYTETLITVDEGEGDEKTDNNNTEIKWSDSKLPSVNLPGFTAKDIYEDLGFASIGANGSLTIRTPDDDKYVIDTNGKVVGGANEIKLSRETASTGINYFKFVPTKRGTYTATYSATDMNGNSAEKDRVIEIRIGDTELPVITLTNNMKNKLTKGFVVGENDELVIDRYARIFNQENYTAGDLYVEDNKGFKKDTFGDDEHEIAKVTVTITNENGTTIRQQETTGDENLVKYKFDTEGTYTITFSVNDACGNTGRYTTTFKVSKDKASTLDTTKIVGIVLIVASVLVLGGVVIYFLKGTKFLPKRKKKGAVKKDKPENSTKTEE